MPAQARRSRQAEGGFVPQRDERVANLLVLATDRLCRTSSEAIARHRSSMRPSHLDMVPLRERRKPELLRCVPTIHGQGLTDYERGIIGAQPGSGLSDLLRPSHPSDRV